MKTLRFFAATLAGMALLAAAPTSAGGQGEPKEYRKWSQKDAEKYLNDSPWAKRVGTKIEYEKAGSDKQQDTGAYRTGMERGEMRESEHATVVWWSARTPRRAFLRLAELSGAQITDEQAEQFAEREMQHFAVTVWGGGNMVRLSAGLSEEDLKKAAWLDHPRLKRRIAPVDVEVVKDPQGKPDRIRFGFPREVDGQPTVLPTDKRLVFKWRLPKDPKETLENAKQFEVIFNPEKMKSGKTPDF